MDLIPNEILDEIATFLPKSDLLALRLVERRLRNTLTRRVFGELLVVDTFSSVQKFDGLVEECEDSAIFDAVESIVFDGKNPDHFDLGADSTLEIIERPFSKLHLFPNLASLRFEFFPSSGPDEGEGHVPYYEAIQVALWNSLEQNPFPSLRSLHIGSMISLFPRLVDDSGIDPFFRLFRPLTSLSLLIVSVITSLRGIRSMFLFNENLHRMLRVATNITTLELGTSAFLGPTSPFQFEQYRFPALKSLRLHKIVLPALPIDVEISPLALDTHGSIPGQPLTAETFIRNHRTTLRRLELHDCAAAFPNGAWHRVFRRFQLGLPELAEFIWSITPDLDAVTAQNFLYASTYGKLNNYRLVHTPDPQADLEDAAALESLQSTVLLRRNK